jgi:hypothetical protein
LNLPARRVGPRDGLLLFVVALMGLPARPARADEPVSHTSRAPADIILVGEDAPCAGVQEVVGELLSRDGVAVTWTRQKHFRPEDIFDRGGSPPASPPGRPGGAEVGVVAWIDLSAPVEARLYFRDAGADRFFIRSLPLARGIDEIAKEEIAHIVSNAVVALRQGGGAALTRSQAHQALHVQPSPEAAPEAGGEPSAPLRFDVAAMAGAQLFASDLPVVARGALSLALARGPRWHRTGGSFGAWLDLGYQFPGRYQGSAVGADLQIASGRAGVLWQRGRTLLLRLGLGAGADRVHYRPRGDTTRVELASASSFTIPVLSSWVGTELRLLDWLALTSRLSFDAALARIHFDLQDGHGQTTRVLVPYPLLPAAFIGLATIY